MTQFVLPEIWKRHAILLGIHVVSSSTNISVFGCQFKNSGEDSERADDSNGDYKGTADRKTHSDRSDEKRIPEFVGEGIRLTTQSYIKCLEEAVLPRMASG